MILITGGAFQGKKAYVAEHFQLEDQDFINGADCTEAELFHAKAVTDFQEYVRRVTMPPPWRKNCIQRIRISL